MPPKGAGLFLLDLPPKGAGLLLPLNKSTEAGLNTYQIERGFKAKLFDSPAASPCIIQYMFLYNYKVKVVGRPIGGRDEPVVDGDEDGLCWEGTSRQAPCPPDAIKPNAMMRPDGRIDRSAPSILPRGREDSRGQPEEALTREEALVIGVRYMRNRDGEYLSPEEASGMLETPWPEVRRREAIAMRKLRQAGFSPEEIADYFTNEWRFGGGPRR